MNTKQLAASIAAREGKEADDVQSLRAEVARLRRELAEASAVIAVIARGCLPDGDEVNMPAQMFAEEALENLGSAAEHARATMRWEVAELCAHQVELWFAAFVPEIREAAKQCANKLRCRGAA